MADWNVAVKVPMNAREQGATVTLEPATGELNQVLVKVYWSVGRKGASRQKPLFGYPDDYDTTERSISAQDLQAAERVNIAANIYLLQPLKVAGTVKVAGVLKVAGQEVRAEAELVLQAGDDSAAAALVWWVKT